MQIPKFVKTTWKNHLVLPGCCQKLQPNPPPHLLVWLNITDSEENWISLNMRLKQIWWPNKYINFVIRTFNRCNQQHFTPNTKYQQLFRAIDIWVGHARSFMLSKFNATWTLPLHNLQANPWYFLQPQTSLLGLWEWSAKH